MNEMKYVMRWPKATVAVMAVDVVVISVVDVVRPDFKYVLSLWTFFSLHFEMEMDNSVQLRKTLKFHLIIIIIGTFNSICSIRQQLSMAQTEKQRQTNGFTYDDNRIGFQLKCRAVMLVKRYASVWCQVESASKSFRLQNLVNVTDLLRPRAIPIDRRCQMVTLTQRPSKISSFWFCSGKIKKMHSPSECRSR